MDESSTKAERWLSVVGWEDRYKVSDLGRVRSLDRRVVDVSGRRTRVFRGIILSQTVMASGYKMVHLCSVESGSVSRYVHHLVLEAFIGPRPEGMEGCHGLQGPGDNNVTNVRWDSHQENMLDIIRHGNHYWKNRVTCAHGHVLGGPNIAPYAEKGTRRCWACALARGKASKARQAGKPYDLVVLRTECYRGIISGVFPADNKDKVSCRWGHSLAEPNLVPSMLRKGCRNCLACSRAKARCRRAKRNGVMLDFQVCADEYYGAIIVKGC